MGRYLALLVVSLLHSACATLPPPVVQPRSTAIIDGAQTSLAQLVASALPHVERSGFRLQPPLAESLTWSVESGS